MASGRQNLADQIRLAAIIVEYCYSHIVSAV